MPWVASSESLSKSVGMRWPTRGQRVGFDTLADGFSEHYRQPDEGLDAHAPSRECVELFKMGHCAPTAHRACHGWPGPTSC